MPIDYQSGIILAGVFGGLLFIACIISSVKAIKDRKRIKARIATRDREKRNGNVDNASGSGVDCRQNGSRSKAKANNGCSIEEDPEFSDITKVPKTQPPTSRNGSSVISGDAHPPPSYRQCTGVDNLTFSNSERSFEEKTGDNHVPQKEETRALSKSGRFMEDEMTRPRRNRTVSRDSGDRKNKRFTHLPSESSAVQKTIRRHSYELAVTDFSWLPSEQPSFASSKTIVKTYSNGQRTVGFENRAFDVDDWNKRA